MQAALLPTNARAKIMVVEDEALIRLSLADEFRCSGFTVVEAASADEAWAYLASGDEPQLVVTDVQMPGAMNGLDLACRIRQRNPRLPIILVSGNITQSETRHVGTLVTKPYCPTALISLAIRTLDVSSNHRSE